MGVEDHRPRSLVGGDDLVEAGLGGEAHKAEAREDHPAMLADDLEVLENLRRELGPDLLDEAEMIGKAVADLEIGDVRVDLERAERGMVPAVFEHRAGVAGPVVVVAPVDEPCLGAAAEERQEPVHRVRGDHEADERRALVDMGGDALEVAFRRWGPRRRLAS